jgi:hypothetical protein
VEGERGVSKPKIWKWPVGHPVWPHGGWAWTVPSLGSAWWPARSHEDALAHVATYYETMKALKS